jgi:hypothetical protein
MNLDTYRDALFLARQHGDDRAIRSLQCEIRRLRHAAMLAELTALGAAEMLRRIRLVAQQDNYSGAIARRILRELQPAAFA